ncbi:MAG: Ig-like domain-containing protein [Myxococcota bacterium]
MWILTAPALANGLTAHQWVTVEAVERLPDGPLRDLVTEQHAPLLTGNCFPDGGYAVGHAYGEAAHWEPFQTAYLRWIRDTYGDDFAGAGAEHVAFLMGLASHGMSDTTYDGTFYVEAQANDPAESFAAESWDEATDMVVASERGPGETPDPWIPAEPIVAILGEQGIAVDAATLEDGTQLAQAAIDFVGIVAQDEETVDEYRAEFPWATAHVLDEDRVCTPECGAGLVALYWQALWERLEGDDGWRVLATLPADGAMGVATEGFDARLHVVMSRGLATGSVTAASVTVADADGNDSPVEIDLYYGETSHLINVIPTHGWAADTDYFVTVHPGIDSWDGEAELGEPHNFEFSTREPPEPPGEDDASPSETDEDPRGCGGGGAWLLIGPALLKRRDRALTTPAP